jgi:hypothetical protein
LEALRVKPHPTTEEQKMLMLGLMDLLLFYLRLQLPMYADKCEDLILELAALPASQTILNIGAILKVWKNPHLSND